MRKGGRKDMREERKINGSPPQAIIYTRVHQLKKKKKDKKKSIKDREANANPGNLKGTRKKEAQAVTSRKKIR